MKPIRFRFSPIKARAAIQWMLDQQPRMSLHAVLQACYFADKQHLNEHGRPIFGATYRAMRFGPMPIEIYEMIKGEPIWLAELSADRYPWRLDGYHLQRAGNEPPELRVLSATDIEALEAGFETSRGQALDERSAITHGPDWQSAELGIMRYEDMIDETESKPERVAYLRATAPRLRL